MTAGYGCRSVDQSNKSNLASETSQNGPGECFEVVARDFDEKIADLKTYFHEEVYQILTIHETEEDNKNFHRKQELLLKYDFIETFADGRPAWRGAVIFLCHIVCAVGLLYALVAGYFSNFCEDWSCHKADVIWVSIVYCTGFLVAMAGLLNFARGFYYRHD